jgi:hypothetical protein
MKDKTSKAVQFSLDGIINNPVTKRQLEGFLEEIVICRQAIKTQRGSIKDILIEAKDSLGIPGKILNGLANEKMNPGSIDQKQHDIEEISDLATGLGIKE